MEEKLEEPTPQNSVTTFGGPGVLASIRKRPPQDQPQHPVDQLSPQVREHVRSGVNSVVLLVKFFDGIWELVGFSRVQDVRLCWD